jgi:hypothetical protein
MNKTTKFAAILITCLAVCGAFAFVFWPSAFKRSLSSQLAMHDRNVATLHAIPLVPGVEHAEADEDALASDLIGLFSSFANHNVSPDGTVHRGTHSKGKCFNGQLEIDATAEPRFRQGLWAQSGPFPVVIRFANADGLGRVQPDTTPDVRGFSFSVRNVSGLPIYSGEARQDFMMNSTAGFASGGIHEFTEVVKMANIAVYHDLHCPPNPLYLKAAVHDLGLINKGNSENANLKSLAHTEFWGNLPYTHGLKADGTIQDVVKYKATPCDGQGTQRVQSTSGLAADYLQSDIAASARAGSVCMLIQVQVFDPAAMRSAATASQAKWSLTDWVEQGGLEWSDRVLPFHTVGRVNIPAGADPEISCDDQYINTRLHSNPANQPVGSIARVRTLIEENSRAKRMSN